MEKCPRCGVGFGMDIFLLVLRDGCVAVPMSIV